MKKLILFLMCGILVFSLIACSNKNIDIENTTTPSANSTTPDVSKPDDTETPSVPEDTTSKEEQIVPTNPDNTGNNGEENEETNNNDTDSGNQNDAENNHQNENDTNTEDNNQNFNTDADEDKKPNNNNNNDSDSNSDSDSNNESNNENDENDENNQTDSEIAGDTTPHVPTEIEQLILDLMNQERKKAGLNALTYNAEIYECGVIRANEAMDVWSHTRPNGTKYWTVYEDCGKTITNCCGENLAKTFKDPYQIVEMLMNSEAHRKNILYEDFKSVCVVVLVDENGYYYMAQCFMG